MPRCAGSCCCVSSLAPDLFYVVQTPRGSLLPRICIYCVKIYLAICALWAHWKNCLTDSSARACVINFKNLWNSNRLTRLLTNYYFDIIFIYIIFVLMHLFALKFSCDPTSTCVVPNHTLLGKWKENQSRDWDLSRNFTICVGKHTSSKIFLDNFSQVCPPLPRGKRTEVFFC